MDTFLFAPDPTIPSLPDIEAKLNRLVPGLRRIDNVEQAASEIGAIAAQQKAIVLYVSDGLENSEFQNFINMATRYRSKIFFILVSSNIRTEDYKRLIQTGGADWVSATGSLEEIPDIVRKQARPVETEPITAHESAPRKGKIISFVPTTGGVGNTTIALETALLLKRKKALRSQNVCYVDLDFQTSHVCDYLDIQPRLKLEEIIDRPERMDRQLLELFVSHHSSGLDVFAGPPSKLDTCEIGMSALDVLLEQIVENYDIVLLDLPVLWFSWTAPTIENADLVFLTAINTVPCLRLLRANIDAVQKLGKRSSQIGIVINRGEVGVLGKVKRRRHVERTVGDQNTFYVNEDRRAIDRVNRGVPAALGGSLAKMGDLEKIATFCESELSAISRATAPKLS